MELEKTLEVTSFQLSHHRQGCHPTAQVATRLIQPGLECLQWQGNFSEQTIPSSSDKRIYLSIANAQQTFLAASVAFPSSILKKNLILLHTTARRAFFFFLESTRDIIWNKKQFALRLKNLVSSNGNGYPDWNYLPEK